MNGQWLKFSCSVQAHEPIPDGPLGDSTFEEDLCALFMKVLRTKGVSISGIYLGTTDPPPLQSVLQGTAALYKSGRE